MVSTCEADALVCKFLYQRVSADVIKLNGLNFVSARPTLQPCVSVLMVQRIQEQDTDSFQVVFLAVHRANKKVENMGAVLGVLIFFYFNLTP